MAQFPWALQAPVCPDLQSHQLLPAQASPLLPRLPGLLQALPHPLLLAALQRLASAHRFVLPQRLALMPLLHSLLLFLLLSLLLAVRQQRPPRVPHALHWSAVLTGLLLLLLRVVLLLLWVLLLLRVLLLLLLRLLRVLARGMCPVALPLPQRLAAQVLPALLPLAAAPALTPGPQPRQLHLPSALRLPPLPPPEPCSPPAAAAAGEAETAAAAVQPAGPAEPAPQSVVGQLPPEPAAPLGPLLPRPLLLLLLAHPQPLESQLRRSSAHRCRRGLGQGGPPRLLQPPPLRPRLPLPARLPPQRRRHWHPPRPAAAAPVAAAGAATGHPAAPAAAPAAAPFAGPPAMREAPFQGFCSRDAAGRN
jgi:hypothetical protein